MGEIATTTLPLLALTGAIGSGKSTVAELFRQHGALVFSADQISREILEPGEPGWLALRSEVGSRYFGVDGRLDRGALRRAIFSDANLRSRVDGLLHPLIRARIKALVVRAPRADWPEPTRVPPFRGVVVEVPLLYEAGWQADYPCVVVVASDTEQALARLMARDSVNRAEAGAALAAQMPLTDKEALADLVIDNRGDLAATVMQVARLVERLNGGVSCRRYPSPA